MPPRKKTAPARKSSGPRATHQEWVFFLNTIRSQILQDMADGTVPTDVRDFASLHDYTDANFYGHHEGKNDWIISVPTWRRRGLDWTTDMFNRAYDAIDEWLQNGRTEAAFVEASERYFPQA